LILLGTLTKVRGNRGEIIYSPVSENDNLIPQAGEYVFLQSKNKNKKIKIEFVRIIQNQILIKFENINTIAEAFRLASYQVYAERRIKSESSPASLISFRVFDTENEFLGLVTDVEQRFQTTYMIVSGNKPDCVLEIPYVNEYIVSIDTKNQIIIVELPSGFREINQ
jgi:16S rRNA processing protein RimM